MLRKGAHFKATNDDGLVTEWVVIHQSDSAAYLMALPASTNPETLNKALDRDAEYTLTPDDDIPTIFNYREVVAIQRPDMEAWQDGAWVNILALVVGKGGNAVSIPTGPVL